MHVFGYILLFPFDRFINTIFFVNKKRKNTVIYSKVLQAHTQKGSSGMVILIFATAAAANVVVIVVAGICLHLPLILRQRLSLLV